MFVEAVDLQTTDITDEALTVAIGAASAEHVTGAVRELHALDCAVRRAQLRFISTAVETQAWLTDGAGSMEFWLVGALRINYATAKSLVKVAVGLDSLPCLASVFGQGLISWDQLVLVVELATAETDALWSEKVLGYTVPDLRRELRAHRMRSVHMPETTAADQYFSVALSGDHTHYRIRGLLDLENGAVVATAIARLLDARLTDTPPEEELLAPVRSAHALVELASQCLDQEFHANRAMVTVDVDLKELGREDGLGEINDQVVPITVIKRLLCDAKVQVTASLDGVPLGVSRMARTLPGSLKHLVKRRDQGCRFPGCGRKRWVHIHHVRHWADGGPTDVDNMVLLCNRHHRLLHEGNWHIEGKLNETIRFVTPKGRELLSPPVALSAETRNLFSGLLDAGIVTGKILPT